MQENSGDLIGCTSWTLWCVQMPSRNGLPKTIHGNIKAGSIISDCSDITSSLSGWRCGLTITPWQTSESREAVMSRTSCTCFTGQCAEWVATGAMWRWILEWPAIPRRASLNAKLCKANPLSSIGSEVSQVVVPFSWESSTERWRVGGSSLFWRFFALFAGNVCKSRV